MKVTRLSSPLELLPLLPCPTGVTVHCGLELVVYNDGVPLEEGDVLKSVTFHPTRDSNTQLMKQIECEVSSVFTVPETLLHTQEYCNTHLSLLYCMYAAYMCYKLTMVCCAHVVTVLVPVWYMYCVCGGVWSLLVSTLCLS